MRVGPHSRHGATSPVPHRGLQAGAAVEGAQCPQDMVYIGGARRLRCHPRPRDPAVAGATALGSSAPLLLRPQPCAAFEVGETSCPEVLWPDLSAPRASPCP